MKYIIERTEEFSLISKAGLNWVLIEIDKEGQRWPSAWFAAYRNAEMVQEWLTEKFGDK